MSRKDNFTFPRAGVPLGAELEPAFCKDGKPVDVFWQRKGEKVKVADYQHVWCDGILISFSKLTGILLDKIGRKPSTGHQSSRYWRYEGEKLDKRYERLCILRDAQQEGGNSHA